MQEVEGSALTHGVPPEKRPESEGAETIALSAHQELETGAEMQRGSDLWRLLTWIQAGQEGLEMLKEDPQAEEWLRSELQAMEKDPEYQAQKARNQESFLRMVREHETDQD